jgi:DNA-binding response OmpR family regulator
MDLQAFFKDAIGLQRREIATALEQLGQDPTAEAELRRLTHSLKGSGGTYGYPEVSRLAALAESASREDLPATTLALLAMLDDLTSSPVVSILVVDDDPLIGRLLETRLGGTDRVVHLATDLAGARAHLAERAPAVVLLDLFLPDGDGRELLEEIGRANPEVAVVVTTGSDAADLRNACLAMGAVAYVHKPFQLEDLERLVTDILARAGAEAVGRGPITEVYRELAASPPVAVAALLAELHGPGGLDLRSAPEIVDDMMNALDGFLPAEIAIGRWSQDELIAFAPMTTEQLQEALDRARLKVRNSMPPRDGAIASFSAGVTSGGTDLNDSFASAHQAAATATRAGGDRVLGARQGIRPVRVLLAEDDPLTAALIVHRLEREQLDVTHCVDGSSAIDVASAETFELVILDIQMPGIDGFGVLETLRNRHEYAHTPIVILTAVGSERDVVRGFDLGCDDYILKPFSPAELTARVRRFTRQ